MRVSLTDRCNLRCSYCMPPEGLDWLPDETVLSDEEVIRLIRIAVQRLGINEVRFTGGEPLVRRGFVGIVQPVHFHGWRVYINRGRRVGLTRLSSTVEPQRYT